MRALAIVLLVLGALPFLIYPFVVLAGVMSLAGHSSGKEPIILVIVANSFLLGSLAYPLVYLPALVFAGARLAAGERKAALVGSIVPLAFLVLLGVLFALWSTM
jgi:hypothetical protein